MEALSIAPEIVDGALAVVVDQPRNALAVWKGRWRIDLHDLSGTWHGTALPPEPDVISEWTRDDVIAHASAALAASGPPPKAEGVTAQTDGGLDPSVRIGVRDLHRAWLLRAKPWGYALWDGEETVDVYGPEGSHRRAVRVTSDDLASMSHHMLELLATGRRHEEDSEAAS